MTQKKRNLLWHPAPAVLDDLLGVGPGEYDDGVELRVVELVHGVGGDVEERVVAGGHDVADGRQAHDAGLLGAVRLAAAVVLL